jgi:hypothetical protein
VKRGFSQEIGAGFTGDDFSSSNKPIFLPNANYKMMP